MTAIPEAARPQPAPPVLDADLRSEAEDFVVEELPAWTPSGAGEHLLVEVEKRHANTAWVAARLADLAGVPAAEVGYCGRKDRHAVTRQWFSIRLPGAGRERAAPLEGAAGEGWRVLASAWHGRKLRRGDHGGNRFELRLRNVAWRTDAQAAEARLAAVAAGVPNYFGAQRFGRDGGNLAAAARWIAGGGLPRQRDQRAMVLSAARAMLFNRVLAARVEAGTWQEVLDGDVVEAGAPTAPLWGRGRSRTRGAAADVEAAALTGLDAWQTALELVGLQQQRRALIVGPRAFRAEREGDDGLRLAFELPPGAFATVVLEALGVVRDARLTAARETAGEAAGDDPDPVRDDRAGEGIAAPGGEFE